MGSAAAEEEVVVGVVVETTVETIGVVKISSRVQAPLQTPHPNIKGTNILIFWLVTGTDANYILNTGEMHTFVQSQQLARGRISSLLDHNNETGTSP